MKKKLTPKSCGHKIVPLDYFQSYKIILRSVDTILYPHTNLYPTLGTLWRVLAATCNANKFKRLRATAGKGPMLRW